MKDDEKVLIGERPVFLKPSRGEVYLEDNQKTISLEEKEFRFLNILKENRGRLIDTFHLKSQLYGKGADKSDLRNVANNVITKFKSAGVKEDFLTYYPDKGYRMLFNKDIDEAMAINHDFDDKAVKKFIWALIIVLFLGVVWFIADIFIPEQQDVPPTQIEISN